MITEKEQYIIDHYLHLLPLEEKSKLKYPYLRVEEIDEEKSRLAEIIAMDYKDKVFFNNCPNCGKLARTPKAKQCRFCGYDWH